MTLKPILAAGLMSLALPAGALAQTYGDRNFPVCLQNYAPIQYIDCRYTSYPQCQQTASGRSATCLANPYFVPAAPLGRKRRAQG